ncbi:GNAT family N-acetyltransferase [Microbacterium sp.]|uniref:GNAT family N-acetyltransferase n=1 Tax=Microbacterium sp. TaxID=51671 RepID=UPI00281160FA|nr:GNAT family N-acetyltransferase [Microbacterium sp.]
MSIVIERAHAETPGLSAFLEAHHEEISGTAPPESIHALPFDRLLAPGVRLFAGLSAGRAVATGALVPLGDDHEELKSMRTDPSVRGQGVGRAMLSFLLGDAERRGVGRISLETGSDDFFLPARTLYSGAGFRECGPFGRYRPDPNSTFMTLSPLSASRLLSVDTR